MFEQIDLNNWSTQKSKTQIQLPYIKLMSTTVLTQKIISLMKSTVVNPMYIYVTKDDKVYKLRDIEYCIENIKNIVELCGSIKININGTERIICNTKEILDLYGYNDNDASTAIDNSNIINGNSTNRTDEFERIF